MMNDEQDKQHGVFSHSSLIIRHSMAYL